MARSQTPSRNPASAESEIKPDIASESRDERHFPILAPSPSASPCCADLSALSPQPTPPPEEEPPPPPPPDAIPEQKPEFVEERPTPPPKRPPTNKPVQPLSVRQLGIVKLFFATDRRWTGATSQPKWFGSDWNDAQGHLTYGTCDVSIPIKKHTPGDVEKPSIFRMESSLELPAKHVVVYTPQRLAQAEFFDGLANDVRQRDQKEVVIFIHGFNNTFDDAASRLGVLAYDMDFDGIPILYSWTSEGGSWGPVYYVRDEESIKLTNRPLTEFLDAVAQTARDAGAKRLSIVAHSMGNRPLVAAMQALAARANGKVFFDEVVMAAPDVPAQGFATDEWPLMQGTVSPAKRVTLYASSNDKALRASKKVHGYRRIGEGGEGLLLLPGLDTIDASGCNFSYFGLNHTYFGGPGVLNDLRDLLRKGLTPIQRKLNSKNQGTLSYWLIPQLTAR